MEHFLLLLFGQCSSDDDNIDVNMNVLVFMFIPYILTHFYTEIYLEWHLSFHLLSMILCFIALSVTTDNHNQSSVIYTIVVGWVIIGSFLLFEHYYQQFSIFLLAYRNQQTIEEKDRDADRRSAAEMRHMIGNVAHDLKTPLSSFTTGLEVITDILDKNQEVIERLKNPELSRKSKDSLIQEVEDSHSGIGQCLKNIQDTNTFMLMTINRCIDYTKASRGFKLVPKYETVDLLETLRLPLDCMKNIQERISIRLFDDNLKVLQPSLSSNTSNNNNNDLTISKPDPDNPDICSHVITDKQWLQENILCLLSNAVKYSTGGEVTIRVYLIPSERLPIRKAIVAPAPAPSPAIPNNNNNNKYPLSSPQKFRDTLMKHMSFRETVPMLRQMTVNHLFPQANHKRVLPTNRYFEEPHHSPTQGRGDEEEDDPTDEPSLTATKKKAVKRFSRTNTDKIDLHLRFDIEDTGIGMSTEAMNQLFNPFRQAQRLAGGTGLGLYSLAKRMEALNGCYGVSKRSDGKQGSLFWFSIPYKPDQTTAELLHAFQIQKQQSSLSIPSNKGSIKLQRKNSIITIPIAAPAMGQGKSRRLSLISPVVDFDEVVHNLSILLVEDAPSIAKMSSMLLRRMGHTVVCAENGEVALKKVQEHWETNQRGFDLILMDLQMPVMDGLEATRRLREIELEGRPWLPATSTVHSTSTTALTDVSNSLPGNKDDARRSSLVHPVSVIRAFTTRFSMISGISNVSEVMNAYHHAVVGVSANSDDETVNDAMAAGLDAFMPKPFTNDVFNTTVLKVLQSIHKR